MHSDSMNPDVEYRDVIGFPGYKVGADGSIWSCWGKGRCGRMNKPWRKLRATKHDSGYDMVTLTGGNKTCVHRLVAAAFIGEKPAGAIVLHGPNGKNDNSPSNLSYGTRKQNTADRYRDGTVPLGGRHHNVKIPDARLPEVFQLRKDGLMLREIAALFGVKSMAICRILRREARTGIKK